MYVNKKKIITKKNTRSIIFLNGEHCLFEKFNVKYDCMKDAFHHFL
jgi:hypothetical protein